MFQWYDRYNVGHGEIDADHQYLFRLINEFHSALTSGQAAEMISTTLESLLAYTRFHFSREESYMLGRTYDGYRAHKQLHDKLIADLEALRARFQNGDAMVGIELSTFLTDWLINHIMRNDTKLASFLKS
jgi:hemerythrin-like metal-binding protein